MLTAQRRKGVEHPSANLVTVLVISVTMVGMATDVMCYVILTVSCQAVYTLVINKTALVKAVKEINMDLPVT